MADEGKTWCVKVSSSSPLLPQVVTDVEVPGVMMSEREKRSLIIMIEFKEIAPTGCRCLRSQSDSSRGASRAGVARCRRKTGGDDKPAIELTKNGTVVSR